MHQREYRTQAEKFENFYLSTRYPWLRELFQAEVAAVLARFELSELVASIIAEYCCPRLQIGDRLDVLDRRGKEFWYNAVILDIEHGNTPPKENLEYMKLHAELRASEKERVDRERVKQMHGEMCRAQALFQKENEGRIPRTEADYQLLHTLRGMQAGKILTKYVEVF